MSSRSGDGRLACKLLYPSLLFFTFTVPHSVCAKDISGIESNARREESVFFTHENHLVFQSAGLRGSAPTAVDLAFIAITHQRCITEDKLTTNANYIFSAQIVLKSKIQMKRVPRNRSLGINHLSRTFDVAGVLHQDSQSLGQITMRIEMSYGAPAFSARERRDDPGGLASLPKTGGEGRAARCQQSRCDVAR